MILLIILLGSALSDDWNYTESGTDWTDICATGQAQSPIEIDPSITERVDRRSDDLITLEFTLEEVTVEGEFEPAAYKIKGDLGNMTATRGSDNTFYGGVISNIHFHSPSENVINGVQYDLEMHIVMIDPEKSFSYIVFSVNFDKGSKDSEFIAHVIETNEAEVSFSLEALFESTTITDFYTFVGSLTVPPCTEQVLWLLDSKIRTISDEQFNYFSQRWAGNETFADGNGNNRELQEPNGRTVTHYAEGLYLLGSAILYISLA